MGKKSQTTQKEVKETPIIFLDDMEPGSIGPITVMVCRKWDVNNINGRNMSTDFIVSDKKGTVMHCTAKNNIAYYFIDKLQEGCLYSLRDFTLQPNKDEYRIMKDSPYLIQLQGSTIVAKATDDLNGYVRYPFQLVPFEELLPTENKYFVDVVGYVASLGKPSKKSNGSQTLDFSLANERGRHVRVTLWGTLGDDLLTKKEQKDGVYVVILTSMSAKYYLGELCLSSSSSTLVIDNYDIPALTAFKTGLSNVDTNETILPIMQAQTKLETLGQLLQWAREKKDKVAFFRNPVTITNVRTKNSWFNFTCTSGKCRKGVSRKGGNFWCESCDTSVPFPRTRFRLQLDVKDQSAEVVIVLFDETAEKLLNTTARALLDEQNKDESGEFSALPRVLENLPGITHIFEIKSTTYYQYGEYESFNCAQVILPALEIQALDVSSDADVKCNNSAATSSATSLKKISPICTPTKNTEQNKRKFYNEDSDPQVSVYADGEHKLGYAKRKKKTRYIEESESDPEVDEGQEGNQDGKLDG